MHGLRSEEVITGKGGAEGKAVDGVEGVNDSERGEQLAEHEVVDSMQCKMHVACDFVALDRTTDSAALLLSLSGTAADIGGRPSACRISHIAPRNL